jgi:hypothetical protein
VARFVVGTGVPIAKIGRSHQILWISCGQGFVRACVCRGFFSATARCSTQCARGAAVGNKLAAGEGRQRLANTPPQ